MAAKAEVQPFVAGMRPDVGQNRRPTSLLAMTAVGTTPDGASPLAESILRNPLSGIAFATRLEKRRRSV